MNICQHCDSRPALSGFSLCEECIVEEVLRCVAESDGEEIEVDGARVLVS